VRKRAQRLHDGAITVGVPATLWATTERFGSVEQAVASGLVLRNDGGSCR
jgi:hypothetical protein